MLLGDTGYYAKKSISNSALSNINPNQNGSPQKYIKFLEGDLKTGGKAANLGTIVHAIVLEGKQLVVDLTKASDKIKEILDGVFLRIQTMGYEEKPELDSIPDIVVDIAKANNYGNGTYKEERILKDITGKGRDYWTFLWSNSNNIIVSPEIYQQATQMKMSIISKNPVKNLLIKDVDGFNTQNRDVIVYNEIESFWNEQHTGLNLGCKCKIDSLFIYPETKTFSIRDLKTTSDFINFPKNFFDREYHRQISFYEEGAKQFIQNIKGFRGYKPEQHYIVTAESIFPYRAIGYKINPKHIDVGKELYISLLNRVAYHTKTNNWEYSMEEIESNLIYSL